jgi:hypothetical protein
MEWFHITRTFVAILAIGLISAGQLGYIESKPLQLGGLVYLVIHWRIGRLHRHGYRRYMGTSVFARFPFYDALTKKLARILWPVGPNVIMVGPKYETTLSESESQQLLSSGVTNWNDYRAQHPNVLPSMQEARLWGQNLSHANFNDMSLKGMSLEGAKCDAAKFYN